MMSSEKTENEQLSEELADEELNSVTGGTQDSVIDPNPPAEVPSPSESLLDPSSAKRPSNY